MVEVLDVMLLFIPFYPCVKVARPSIFVGTPSIFESLRRKQISLSCKFIITHVLQWQGRSYLYARYSRAYLQKSRVKNKKQ